MNPGTGDGGRGTEGVDRREAIEMLGVGAASAYGVNLSARERFQALRPGERQEMRFFTPAEQPLVRALVDMVIPRDERTGSASDAGAVEYMDFVLSENSETSRTQWHDGLRWYDEESIRRFQKSFAQAAEAERAQILNDIAWPARARSEFTVAASFFSRVRDLTAGAFFSSRMGVEDLRYEGGVFNPNWQGAPPAALTELGVSYTEWDAKYAPRRGPRR